MRVIVLHSDDTVLDGHDGSPTTLLVLHTGPSDPRTSRPAPFVVPIPAADYYRVSITSSFKSNT